MQSANTFPLTVGDLYMPPKKTNWQLTMEWLRTTGVIVAAIVGSVFGFGRLYGADTQDMRRDIKTHSDQLIIANANSDKLLTAFNGLTAALEQSNKDSSAYRDAFIDAIRIITARYSEGEKRRRLQEIVQRMNKGRVSQGSYAGGDAYVSEKQ